jgi:hypothetical protein
MTFHSEEGWPRQRPPLSPSRIGHRASSRTEGGWSSVSALRRLQVTIAFVVVLLATGVTGALASNNPANQYYTITVTDLGSGQYRIDVFSLNPRAEFIKSWWWVPPIGMNVTSVKNVLGGACSVSGGALKCTGSLAPPSCDSCFGSSMTVFFTATGNQPHFIPTSYGGYYIHYAVIGVAEITSVARKPGL